MEDGIAIFSCKALIVGCGLSGLATAIALRRSGHEVIIFERMPELREVGGGIQLSPNATRIFRKWNILESIKQHAYEPVEGTLRSYRGAVLSQQPDGAVANEKFKAPYLVVHRADLIRALVAEAQDKGVRMVFGANVASFDFSKATLVLADGRQFGGDVIFGADGERSVCRDELLGHPDPPRGIGDTIFRTAIKRSDVLRRPNLVELVEQPSINLWLGPEAHAVAYVLRNEILNVGLVKADKASTEVMYGPQRADIEELREVYSGWDPKLRELLELPGEYSKWSLLGIDHVQDWCHPSGKFALIGDAAHAMLPFLAQGAAQAFEDAAVVGTLFRLIKTIADIPDALFVFQQMRQPRVREIKNRSAAQKLLYGLPDGQQQEERDRQLADAGSKHGTLSAMADEEFQQWLLGYDAVLDAERKWKLFAEQQQAMG